MAAADLDPSAPLCPCGIRGCDQYAAHRNAFVIRAKTPRRRSGRRWTPKR
jgi:hypothetical protein